MLPVRIWESCRIAALPQRRVSKVVRILATFAFVVWFAFVAHGPAAAGDAEPAPVSIEYVPSPQTEFDLRDVCCGAGPGFVSLPDATLGTRFDDTSHWLRITTGGQEGVLTLGALVDEADLHFVDPATGDWIVMRSGDTRPASERSLVSARIAFPLPAMPPPAEFYLRIRQPTAISIRIDFVSGNAFRSASQSTAIIRAALFGAAMIMIVFNLTFSVATRDLAFLLNAATVGSVLVLDIYLTGVGSAYLWAEAPWISNYVINLALITTSIAAGLFFYFFLRDPAMPRQYLLRILLISPVIALALVAFLPWVVYWRLQPPIFAVLGMMIAANIAICVLEAWRGNRRARVLLVPFVGCIIPGSALAVGHIVFGQRIGILDEHVLEFALVVEALLFSLALAYRIRIAQQERSEIQHALVRHVRESERRLLAAVDQERSRIAADLHDTAGQGLVAIVNRLARLSRKVNGAREARRELDTITVAARETVGEVRRISHNLHSATLHQLGLSRALNTLAEHAAATTPVTVDLSIDGVGDSLTDEANVHVYGITQELLTNAVRHSGASKCGVKLRADGNDIVLEVTDDGSGMPLPQINGQQAGSGLGLELVAQRVRSLGGRWNIRRLAPGTAFEVRFPLMQSANSGTR